MAEAKSQLHIGSKFIKRRAFIGWNTGHGAGVRHLHIGARDVSLDVYVI